MVYGTEYRYQVLNRQIRIMGMIRGGFYMFHSYVMGIGSSIYDLKKQGFVVEIDGNNYTVSFPEDKVDIWEEFISKHLELGFWNEYLTNVGVVFLFHLQDGIKKYVVKNYEDDEVLFLCEELCKSKFQSIKSMLSGNHFYNDKLI